MNMKYYSTQRPVSPGTYPKPADNKVLEIVNFSDKVFCSEIGRDAWGYIDYEKPLEDRTMQDYELQGVKFYYPIDEQIDACYAFLGIEKKPADSMTEDEMSEAELAELFEWVEHPEYMQLVPRHLETGKYILP